MFTTASVMPRTAAAGPGLRGEVGGCEYQSRRYKGNYYWNVRGSSTQNLVRIIDECPQELALLVLDAFVIRQIRLAMIEKRNVEAKYLTDRLRLTLVGLTLAAVWAGSALADQPGWNSYSNANYGYTGCYPAALFTGQGESDDGDGQTFISPDGAKIWMYGSYRAELPNPTLHGSMREDESAELGTTNKPDLQVIKPDHFVFSGHQNANIVHEKTILRGETFITLLITYPTAKRTIYDPLIGPMMKCFKFQAQLQQ